MAKIYSRRADERVVKEVFTGANPHFSPNQLAELLKCHDDPQYFIDNYLELKNPRLGLTPFLTRPYQQVQLAAMQSTSLFCLQPRQSGATSLPLAYQLWEALFRPNTQHGSAFVTHARAMDGLTQLFDWYNNLPVWLKPGLTYKSRHNLEFDNGSRIIAGAITGNFNRGRSWSTLYADCLAHAKDRDQEDFWLAAIPSLMGGRIIITGTPNGPTNTFAHVWASLIKTHNPMFVAMHIDPLSVYDQFQLDQLLAMIGMRSFKREYNCEFIA